MILLRNRFEMAGSLPPLPRLGVEMRFAGSLDQVEWLGRGPHENYPDRKASADFGRWESPVAHQATDYPRPQETGSHQDTRWVALRDSKGNGVLIVAPQEPFAFSALPYTAHDLTAAKRWVDLRPRRETILSIDATQCGLGNSSCGPGVLQRYAVLPSPAEITYVLAPLRSGEDPAEVARRVLACSFQEETKRD